METSFQNLEPQVMRLRFAAFQKTQQESYIGSKSYFKVIQLERHERAVGYVPDMMRSRHMGVS